MAGAARSAPPRPPARPARRGPPRPPARLTDLQLTLFPAVSVAVGPAGVPSRAGGPPAEGGPGPRLPHRVPEGGVEIVASLLGTPVPCRILRSQRARRPRLVVGRSATVALVLPRRFPLREVPSVLEEGARWLLRTLERQRARPGPSRPALADGREIPFFGERLVLRLLEPEGLDARPRVTRRDMEIRVCVPPLHPRSPGDLLRAWLRAAAATEIPRRVQTANEPLGLPLARIGVRDQSTKWGACSAAGNLSFNWRLALAPPDVLDYVIVHELCHLRELNHSPRFWALVRALRPDYERHRAWLREHGETLEV